MLTQKRHTEGDNPLIRLNMYDKTLYLQRIFFALDRTAKFENETDPEGTRRLTVMHLRGAEEQIDKAIELLEYVLELRRIFPRYDNFNQHMR